MNEDKETPERRKKRLRQEESKRNPTGNMSDAFNRAEAGNLADLVGRLGWKGTGIIILVIIIAFIIISMSVRQSNNKKKLELCQASFYVTYIEVVQ